MEDLSQTTDHSFNQISSFDLVDRYVIIFNNQISTMKLDHANYMI